jgi:PhnB protein
MPTIDPYLIFDGNCAEAMRHYERVLGGKLEVLMTQGESPMKDHCAPGDANRIMHARLKVQDRLLMASDSMGGDAYEGQKGVAIAIAYPGTAEAGKAFDALAQGGQVTMPMMPTFWAESFGMLTDRFGTSWMVSGGPKPVAQAA